MRADGAALGPARRLDVLDPQRKADEAPQLPAVVGSARDMIVK
jgi:hypothetical protein